MPESAARSARSSAPARSRDVGRAGRARPGLEPQRLEAHVGHARLGQRAAHGLGPALEQQLRVDGARRLERPPARRLLEVLLDVVEQLLGLAQQAELEVLGLLRHRVEGEHATSAIDGSSTAPTKIDTTRPRESETAASRLEMSAILNQSTTGARGSAARAAARG